MADDSEKYELVPPENDPPVEAPVQSSADMIIQSSGQGGDDSSVSTTTGGTGETSFIKFIGSPEKSLEDADEMMERGLKAMGEKDYDAAIKCFSHALNIKVSQYGNSAVECCDAYHKYGRALFCKALRRRRAWQSTVLESGQDGESTKKQKCTEADEADEDLAWKMLNIAWEIVQNTDDQSRSITTRVNILNELAAVADLVGDPVYSVHYCGKLLSILEGVVEPDNIDLAVCNYRMSDYLEKCAQYASAIPYCQKAIFICKARTMRESTATSSPTPSPSLSLSLSLQPEKPTEQDQTRDEEAEIQQAIGYGATFTNKLLYLQHIVADPSTQPVNMMRWISDISQGLSTSTISATHSSTEKNPSYRRRDRNDNGRNS